MLFFGYNLSFIHSWCIFILHVKVFSWISFIMVRSRNIHFYSDAYNHSIAIIPIIIDQRHSCFDQYRAWDRDFQGNLLVCCKASISHVLHSYLYYRIWVALKSSACVCMAYASDRMRKTRIWLNTWAWIQHNHSMIHYRLNAIFKLNFRKLTTTYKWLMANQTKYQIELTYNCENFHIPQTDKIQ